jgi:hypothetical protein
MSGMSLSLMGGLIPHHSMEVQSQNHLSLSPCPKPPGTGIMGTLKGKQVLNTWGQKLCHFQMSKIVSGRFVLIKA